MVLLILFLALIVYKAEFISDGYSACLSEKTTKSVRGICTLVVILHHLAQKFRTEMLFSMIFTELGFLAVTLFFFYSGYGLMKRYISKANYQKTFLVKRVGSVLVPYGCVILLYWLVDCILGNPHTPLEVLRSLYNGYPIVTDSWYILTIIVFYLFFYLLMRLFKERYAAIAIGSCLWCVAWIVLTRTAGYEVYWYNTAVCICFGIIAAIGEARLLNWLKKHYVVSWIAALAVFFPCFGILYLKNPAFPIGLGLRYLCEAAFVAIVLLVTIKFGTKNRIWDFFAGISLEAYLCHRLFMNLLRSQYVYVENDTVWALAVIGSTAAAAFVLHKLFGKLNLWVQKVLLPGSSL